jgi:hypothetical protein
MATEPLQIVAGDSLGWTRDADSLSYIDSSGDSQDCPASTWTLTYFAISKDGKFNFSASATGENFLVNLAATITQTWHPGSYRWKAFAIQGAGATRYQVDEGSWEVLPNFEVQVETDFRSIHEQMLSNVNAVLVGKSPTHHTAMSIGGRSISEMSYQELIAVKIQLENRVDLEKAQEDISHGKTPQSGKILARFGSWD